MHRCDTNDGRSGKGDGCYLLHLDGIPAGGFNNWRDGEGWQDWTAETDDEPSAEERAKTRARMEQARIASEQEREKRQAEAREKAADIWAMGEASGEHAYLTRKRIPLSGAKLHQGSIVLSLRDGAGTLHSLQFIAEDGGKLFLSGGRKQGCYFAIGKPDSVLCIAEGFATACTIREATGHAVAIAFDAGNLLPVAKALQAKLSNVRLIICADDDWKTVGNPGITKATEAANAVAGYLAVPDFTGTERGEKDTDFNDVARLGGLEAVKKMIANAEAPEARDDWPEPMPLAAMVLPEPYPIDALPDIIRAAVEEVQSFAKAPFPLVASSALAAVSLAVQAHVDMKRAEKLSGPVGLFLLTIAESGERKSTCDGFFVKSIREYQDEQAEVAKPVLTAHRADISTWEAKRAAM